MTVGALNTMYRRYAGTDPMPRTGVTPACPACLAGDCTRCTAHDDTARLRQGLATTQPACTHDCTDGRPLTPREKATKR